MKPAMLTLPMPVARLPGRAGQAPSLGEEALSRAAWLLRFNWLLATYLHVDWQGPWASALACLDPPSDRLVRHASLALVEQHGLHDRYLLDLDLQADPWLRLEPVRLQPVAEALGVAMLGGWVQTALERESVAHQHQVLTPAQRRSALQQACTMRHLPHGAWPLPSRDPLSVQQLGWSCMAALPRVDCGAGVRFSMQFARGTLTPLRLDAMQRTEARQLIANTLPSTPDDQRVCA